MSKKRTTWAKTRLRSEAESRLLKVSGSGDTQLLSEDQQRHELEVHKVELEIQNEQLVEAQAALELSRDRYIDLYEFAPVGYLTLSREGIIREINLSGTISLGGGIAKSCCDADSLPWFPLRTGIAGISISCMRSETTEHRTSNWFLFGKTDPHSTAFSPVFGSRMAMTLRCVSS